MQINCARLNMYQPACYYICVQGVLPAHWVDHFGDLTLVKNSDALSAGMTILQSAAIDQAALLGILNQLYGMGLPLISVKWQEQDAGQVVAPKNAQSPER